PRLIGYGAALLLMIGMFVVTVGNMAQVNLDVQRDRNVLYREARGGAIENVYIIKVMNKGQETRTFTLAVEGQPALDRVMSADRMRMIGMFVVTLGNMAQVNLDVQRGRNVLYREARGGAIENVYIIKVMNKGQETRTFTLAVEGHPELDLVMSADRLTVEPSSLLQVPVNVQLEPEFMEGTNMPITFIVTAADDDSVSAISE